MRALALLSLGVALVALVSCNPCQRMDQGLTCHAKPPDPCHRVDTVYLDPAFTPEERDAIDYAAEAWTRGTGICWQPTIQYNRADVRILRADSEADILDPHPPTAVGLCSPRNRRLWIVPTGSGKTRVATITAHEIGHYLGLDHTEGCPGPVTLMCPVIDDAQPLTGDIPPGDLRRLGY